MTTQRIYSELSSTIRTVARLREELAQADVRHPTWWVLRVRYGYHRWAVRTLTQMLHSTSKS